jgi:pilus assembly protein CpaE
VSLTGIRFLVLLGDGVDGAAIRAALPPTAPVQTSALREAVLRVPVLLEDAAPDVVLVASADLNSMLGVIRDISSREPNVPIAVLYGGNPDNGFMGAAFEAGAEDVIVLPQPARELSFAIEKAIAHRRGPHQGALAPLIAVLGPKGGTGKTLTACNLAVALAHLGQRPVVMDIDLQFGDVGLALGLRPDKTIYDLAVAAGDLDADKVESFLTQHPSGAHALLAPTRPDHAAAVTISFLRSVFELLRSRYDFVIVDTPPAFSPEVITAVDSASHLCLVGMLDVLSLKDTKIGVETLARMGYDPSELTVVLNRADTSVGIAQADVEQLLGRAPDILVPSDRAIPKAITAGRTIVEEEPKSGAARAFSALADHYLKEAEAVLAAAASPTEQQAGTTGRRFALRRR